MSFGYGFQNPPVGGQGVIARPQFQSINYVPGVSGWAIFRDGNAEFRSIIVPPGTGNGATVFIQATTPVALNVGDLWYDTSNGLLLHQWDGSTWGPFQISTGAIAPGSIVAALIAAHTITAAQIAAGTITATEIQVGIILAGIINGTTVNAATFTGSIFKGADFQIDSTGFYWYSAAPGAGTLQYSLVLSATTHDPFGNTVLPGFTIYLPQSPGPTWDAFNFNFFSQAGSAIGDISYQRAATGPAGTYSKVHEMQFFDALLEFTQAEIQFDGQVTMAGATVANPTLIATDVWHNFSLVSGVTAGTDINGTSYPPAYKLLPDGNVALRGVASAAAGGLAAGTTWAVIPAAYRPVTNIPTALVANGTVGTFAHVYIRPNGNVQFDKALGGGVSMYLDTIVNVAGT